MDPGLNFVDQMNRRALLDAGLGACIADSPVGLQSYFTGGAGESTLLLLHGAGDHAGAWARILPAVLATGRYRVVIPDLAGHGASAPEDGPLTMQTFLTGLNAIAADTHDAIVVGNSFGAWLAIVWALEHPRSVRRAVLVNGGPVTGIRPDLTLTPSDRVEARRMWESLVDSSRWNVPELVFDEIIRKGREGAIARMSIPSMQPYLMDRRLPEIRIPVDLIWGESDQMVPLDYARRLASELPNARLVTIPVCGHVPQLECADRFTSTLLGVLSAC